MVGVRRLDPAAGKGDLPGMVVQMRGAARQEHRQLVGMRHDRHQHRGLGQRQQRLHVGIEVVVAAHQRRRPADADLRSPRRRVSSRQAPPVLVESAAFRRKERSRSSRQASAPFGRSRRRARPARRTPAARSAPRAGRARGHAATARRLRIFRHTDRMVSASRDLVVKVRAEDQALRVAAACDIKRHRQAEARHQSVRPRSTGVTSG